MGGSDQADGVKHQNVGSDLINRRHHRDVKVSGGRGGGRQDSNELFTSAVDQCNPEE